MYRLAPSSAPSLLILLLATACGGATARLSDADEHVRTPLVGTCQPGDPIELADFDQDGRTLYLQVRHGGGCDRHTYVACLEDPHPHAEQVWSLRIHHDAHGDVCRGELTPVLRIDLDQDITATAIVGGAVQLE